MIKVKDFYLSNYYNAIIIILLLKADSKNHKFQKLINL